MKFRKATKPKLEASRPSAYVEVTRGNVLGVGEWVSLRTKDGPLGHLLNKPYEIIHKELDFRYPGAEGGLRFGFVSIPVNGSDNSGHYCYNFPLAGLSGIEEILMTDGSRRIVVSTAQTNGSWEPRSRVVDPSSFAYGTPEVKSSNEAGWCILGLQTRT